MAFKNRLKYVTDDEMDYGSRSSRSIITMLLISDEHCQITVRNYVSPGSKCEAVRLGVHMILLYFLKIFF